MTSPYSDMVLNPARRAQAQAEQAALREKYGHLVARHPAQAKYLYGRARETMVIDQLNALREAEGEDSALGTVSDGEIAMAARRLELFRQLSEGLAAQGLFHEAFQAAQEGQDAERARGYALKAEAIEQLGRPRCDCPAWLTLPSAMDAKGERRAVQHKIEEIWNNESVQVIDLYRCSICGIVSAR